MLSSKNMKDIKAVILSAGSGKRLGRPKAFLTYRNHTFVEEIYEHLRSIGLSKIAVVTTTAQHKALTQLYLPDAEVIINFTPQHGQFSSVRLAVITTEDYVKALLIVPVDHPAVRPETYSALIHHWSATSRNKIVIPAYNGQRGHPIILPRWLFSKIKSAPFNITLRDIIKETKENIDILQVSDPGVILNVNTPEDYQRLLSSH
ncbi:nucleotidyltransferase family protein [Candidatus Sumerlaeota bacterium]|nr:nucleotidyltransferase family protein [Candidatus Sumerlaeota bacterium]